MLTLVNLIQGMVGNKRSFLSNVCGRLVKTFNTFKVPNYSNFMLIYIVLNVLFKTEVREKFLVS